MCSGNNPWDRDVAFDFLKRMSPDGRRGAVVALIVLGALVGIWRQGTQSEEPKPADGCWMPGFPRYPGAELETVLHDEKSWYASLKARDTAEQVADYYGTQLASATKSSSPPNGRFHYVAVHGSHPAGAGVMVSITQDHPEESEWAIGRKFDLGTTISVTVLAPPDARGGPSWPFGPEHPPHRSFYQAFAEFMLEHLGNDDDEPRR